MTRLHSPARAVLTLVLLLLLTGTATAQAIIPTDNTLPACAQTCVLLQQAQTGCIPSGGAPVSDQATYDSCFCQSALITGLKTAGSADICPAQCSAADFATIQKWYTTLCSAVAAGQAPAPAGAGAGGPKTTTTSTPTNGPTTTSTSAAASSTAAAATAASDPSDTQAEGAGTEGGAAWWSDHWKWVVMVIVLFVVFSTIGIVGTILYRRHKRRRDYGDTFRVQGSQNMGAWGPNSASHHDLGPGQQPVTNHQGGAMNPEMASAPAGSGGGALGAAAMANADDKGKGKMVNQVTTKRLSRRQT